MTKLFAAATTAATIFLLASAPANAQQPQRQCPPGQQAVGAYCETRGPAQNCPPGTQPSGVYCESVGNRGQVRGASLSGTDITALKQRVASKLLSDVNAQLKASKLGTLKTSNILITNTTTGFIASVEGLQAKPSRVLSDKGVVVGAVGCVVSRCQFGYNVRYTFTPAQPLEKGFTNRAYNPQRKVLLKAGESANVVLALQKTQRNKRKLAAADSAAVRVVTRTRTSDGTLVNRVVKTLKLKLS